MKNKTVWFLGLVLFGFLVFGTGMVVGQGSNELPKLTTACETKAGLIFGMGDGFSILKKCPGNSRMVALGGTGNETGSGGQINIGGVVYFSNSGEGPWILKEDGTIWNYGESGSWEKNERRSTLPVTVDQVLYWDYNSLITRSGDIYRFDGSWLLIGSADSIN